MLCLSYCSSRVFLFTELLVTLYTGNCAMSIGHRGLMEGHYDLKKITPLVTGRHTKASADDAGECRSRLRHMSNHVLSTVAIRMRHMHASSHSRIHAPPRTCRKKGRAKRERARSGYVCSICCTHPYSSHESRTSTPIHG